jgi:hypothetical protein
MDRAMIVGQVRQHCKRLIENVLEAADLQTVATTSLAIFDQMREVARALLQAHGDLEAHTRPSPALPPCGPSEGEGFHKLWKMWTLLPPLPQLLSPGSSGGLRPGQLQLSLLLLPRWHCGPRFRHNGPLRPWLRAQQGHQQGHPARATHAHQPQASRPPRPRTPRAQRRHVRQRARRNVVCGHPPPLRRHSVATATASQSRAARSGARRRVRCHCQPARLGIVKPCAIQARRPYQQASLASGGRAVRSSPGAVEPSAHRANNGHAPCRPAC